MKSKLISDSTYVLVFDKDDEVAAQLLRFASEKKIVAAHFNALGAFSEVTFGWFDRAAREYKPIEITGGIEVLSFVGNLATTEAGEPRLHAHVAVSKRDGSAHGGHFFEGRVWPTMEMILTTTSTRLIRSLDEECGLALIDLDLG